MEGIFTRRLDLQLSLGDSTLSRPIGFASVLSLVAGVAFLAVIRFAIIAIYRLYFHPLKRYPGPWYVTISNLPYLYISNKGILYKWLHEQHQKYGHVVRTGPNKLSYTNPQAWKDIYGHRSGGRKDNPKDKRFYGREYNGEYHVLNTPESTDHARQRKTFSYAFSDRALKLQESLIAKYVDKFIDKIYETSKDKVPMVKLYNCTTFDIMADLTFGEPLGMLDKGEYTPWVEAVFGNMKMGDLLRIQLEYPWLQAVARMFIPRSLREQERLHFQHSADRVDRRLAKGMSTESKPDIWNLVFEKPDHGLTLPQMHANAALFMLAGTETTATLLSGLTYHLLKNTDKLQRVADEVRTLLKEELSLEHLPRLPYLNACFEEGLRMYPPVPIGPARVVGEGGNAICGEWIPGSTQVSVPHFATYHSAQNFKEPDSFVPERWLPNTPGYEGDSKEALQPFSTGPRNCIGKNLAYHEMRLILAKLLWHFDLALCVECDNWADQDAWTLWDKPELWCNAMPIR